MSQLKINENLPSNSFLPSEEEMQYPVLNSTIEDLELKIFDKEQKIIFRDKEILKLKDKLKILSLENKTINEKNLELENKIITNLGDNKDSLSGSNIKLKKSNKLIKKIQNENNELVKDIKEAYFKLNLIKNEKEKSIEDLNIKVLELKKNIENQDLIIKNLKDFSHH